MADETRFSDIGKRAAIEALFDGTPYKPFQTPEVETSAGDRAVHASCALLEGTDFDLVYFPLRHLGYKAVLRATGDLYASMAHPATLSVVIGVSAKLDLPQIREVWAGMVTAAREHGYSSVALDLVPSRNGLSLSISATGIRSKITTVRCPKPKSKDLICVSGRLGAAYLGLQLLEHEKANFDKGVQIDRESALGRNKMLVGAYLKPELSPRIVAELENEEIYPSAGRFVTGGLADAVKSLSAESGLGAKIYADKIPFEGNSFQVGRELDIDPISAAMNGGDDYQLLFTIPILALDKFRHDFQTFAIIGHLAQSEVGAALVTPDGVELPMSAQGWND